MAPKAAGKGKAEDAPPPPPETGSGKFYFKNGATYDGDWVKVPLPKAEGTETKPADVKAAAAAAAAAAAEQPDASQIMRHGNGFYVDGKYKYSGSWANDKMQGTGKFMYASGSVYDGQWDNSKYHGKGTFSWPDGRKYELWNLLTCKHPQLEKQSNELFAQGLWEHNRMHGQGMYTDAEGHQWSGQFFNGGGPGLTCML